MPEPASGDADKPRRRRASGLDGMVLAELQQLAGSLGITGTGRMRKSQLVDAIRTAQGGAVPSVPAVAPASADTAAALARTPVHSDGDTAVAATQADAEPVGTGRQDSADEARAVRRERDTVLPDTAEQDDAVNGEDTGRETARDAGRGGREQRDGQTRAARGEQRDRRDDQDDRSTDRRAPGQNERSQQGGPRDDDEDGDRNRNRRRRRDRRGSNRDRDRRGGGGGGGASGRDRIDEVQVSEDDVLIPAAGILDILDNYAFVRTSGYLPGPNDIYVSLAMVRRSGLRKGDAVTGVVRQPRDGEKQQKFNALVRVDTVNGADPETGQHRPEFSKLTPLYPQDRLRLETEPGIVSTRVTDMERAVKGEVIASTFDRPAEDHTTVAELAIERAKRLVELGGDVVVLLDSITRLGRAYNLAAPASGRILSGGVDSSALYPPKRFFGAARNIENGGSLTILATALVETGSKMDEVIFEEFKGTGNMEVRLSRQLADKRIFPAVDVDGSGTRKEELLMGRDELQITWKLRRVLHALETQQALELLLDRMKRSKSNTEFLMQVQQTMPMPGNGNGGSDDD